MHRFITPLVWTCLIVVGCSLHADSPNVVIIMADDMGFGDITALNPRCTIPTPHLDRLAGEGMRFLDAHSPSAVCTPTRYGLLTGRYSWRTPMKSGVLGGYSKPMLAPDRATIASMLKSAGYRTGAIGKWHLGMQMPLLAEDAKIGQWQGDPGIDFGGVISDSPIHHGFDYYFGVSASLDMAPYVYIRNDRFTMQPTLQQESRPFPYFIRQGPRAEDFVIDRVLDRLTEEAIGFIKQHAPNDHPYFLYVPFTAPHKPTQPNPEFRGRTGLGEYGDFIAQVDDSVGQILAAIDASGQSERGNTLVVFTSDNGSYMFRYDDDTQRDHSDDDTIQGYRAATHTANGPWRGTKADIYEAGHHVPFLVRWPARVEAGTNSESTICHVDLYALCADVAGVILTDAEAEDSFSFLPALDGHDYMRPCPVIHQSGSGMLAIRRDQWKMVAGNGSGGREKPKGKSGERPFQLFDLANDPAEQNDLAGSNPELVTRLGLELDQIRSARGSRQFVTEFAERK